MFDHIQNLFYRCRGCNKIFAEDSKSLGKQIVLTTESRRLLLGKRSGYDLIHLKCHKVSMSIMDPMLP
jgi:hypothetical protein